MQPISPWAFLKNFISLVNFLLKSKFLWKLEIENYKLQTRGKTPSKKIAIRKQKKKRKKKKVQNYIFNPFTITFFIIHLGSSLPWWNIEILCKLIRWIAKQEVTPAQFLGTIWSWGRQTTLIICPNEDWNSP